MSGFTPVNQVRLTNVATVRLQKRGKRFEIACYRNKVLSWRNKLETDIKEVLQIDTVFTNVSKGMLANAKDLMDAFGTSDQRTVCQEILEKGELQVSEQERAALYETIFRDIASIVADKTVNPENNRPYTITMIQNAMRQIQYSVNVSKSSKSQALEVIRKLREVMPIARASMLLRIVCTLEDSNTVVAEIDKLAGIIMTRSSSEKEEFMDVKIDPESFRKMEEIVKLLPGGHGRVEVLQMRMAATGAVAPIASSSAAAAAVVEEEEEELIETKKPAKATSATPELTKRELTKKRDDLQDLLAQVTGMNDIDEDDEDDEYVIVGQMAAKKSKKNKPKKEKTPKDIDSDESGSDEEGTTVTQSTNKTNDTANTTAAGKMVKKSKKDKRFEKEEKREREIQAKLLQERIQAQKQKQQQAEQAATVCVESAEAVATTSTNDASSNTTDASSTSAPVNVASSAAVPAAAPTGKAKSCNTCGGAFHDDKEYRDHFRSEWHRFNLKRKMKNLPVVGSEAEFLALSVEELQI